MANQQKSLAAALNQYYESQTKKITDLNEEIKNLNENYSKTLERCYNNEADEKKLRQQFLIKSIHNMPDFSIEQISESLKIDKENLEIKKQLLECQLRNQKNTTAMLHSDIQSFSQQLTLIQNEITQLTTTLENSNNIIRTHRSEIIHQIITKYLNIPDQQPDTYIDPAELKDKRLGIVIPMITHKLSRILSQTNQQVAFLLDSRREEETELIKKIGQLGRNNQNGQKVQQELETMKNNIKLIMEENNWKQEELANKEKQYEELINPKNFPNIDPSFQFHQQVMDYEQQNEGKSPEYWINIRYQAVKRVKVQRLKEENQITKQKKSVRIFWNFIKQVNDEQIKQKAIEVIKKYQLENIVDLN